MRSAVVPSRSVLVVDDHADLRLVLRLQLERRGWAVIEASSGTEALQRLEEREVDVVLLDHTLPGASGL